MKTEDEKTFILNKLVWRENVLVPLDKLDKVAREFIRCYQVWKSNNTPDELAGHEINVTIALCILEENECWRDVALELKKENWFGATLVLWNLYVQDKKDAISSTVTLPGTLYRDDDLIEWIPLVHYNPLHFHRNVIEFSMKPSAILGVSPSTVLGLAKTRTFLISKTKILKT